MRSDSRQEWLLLHSSNSFLLSWDKQPTLFPGKLILVHRNTEHFGPSDVEKVFSIWPVLINKTKHVFIPNIINEASPLGYIIQTLVMALRVLNCADSLILQERILKYLCQKSRQIFKGSNILRCYSRIEKFLQINLYSLSWTGSYSLLKTWIL